MTAAGNSLAGAFCAGVGFDRWPTLTSLAVASMALYAAGILFNDLFDLEEDRRERPERPLPSGRITVRTVTIVACVLSVIGLAMAWCAGREPGLTATALFAAVMVYDLGAKRAWAGPWVMGLCRGLNLCLGLVLAPAFAVGEALPVAGYVVYVAGVTYVSRQENYVGRRQGLFSGFLLILAGIALVLASVMSRTGFRFENAADYSTSPNVIIALLALFVLMRTLTRAWNRAWADPRPETIRPVVKSGIISLPLLDFAQTLAVAGAWPAGVIVALWVAARATARKLATT